MPQKCKSSEVLPVDHIGIVSAPVWTQGFTAIHSPQITASGIWAPLGQWGLVGQSAKLSFVNKIELKTS